MERVRCVFYCRFILTDAKKTRISAADFRKPGFLRLKNLPQNSQEVFQPQRYLFSRRKFWLVRIKIAAEFAADSATVGTGLICIHWKASSQSDQCMSASIYPSLWHTARGTRTHYLSLYCIAEKIFLQTHVHSVRNNRNALLQQLYFWTRLSSSQSISEKQRILWACSRFGLKWPQDISRDLFDTDAFQCRNAHCGNRREPVHAKSIHFLLRAHHRLSKESMTGVLITQRKS